MKKKFRILSLVLSLVLLFATAMPAGAVEVVPDPYEYFDQDYPPAMNYSASDTGEVYSYTISTTRLPDSDDYHYFVDEEYLGSYSEDIYIEGTLDANVKTWEEGDFARNDHYAALTNLAERVGVAYEVSNHEHDYSFYVGCENPHGYYAVMLSCFHYYVDANIWIDGVWLQGENIYKMPFIYGEYLFVEYLG